VVEDGSASMPLTSSVEERLAWIWLNDTAPASFDRTASSTPATIRRPCSPRLISSLPMRLPKRSTRSPAEEGSTGCSFPKMATRVPFFKKIFVRIRKKKRKVSRRYQEFRDGPVALGASCVVQPDTGPLKSLADSFEVRFGAQRLPDSLSAHPAETDDRAVFGTESLVLEQSSEKGPEHPGPQRRICGTVAGKEKREEGGCVNARVEVGERFLRPECLGEEYGEDGGYDLMEIRLDVEGLVVDHGV
jgi:hypothetical protein